MYGENGIFHDNQCALSLAIYMDGLNLFARDKTSHSTCSMTVILNLPHHICMLAGSMLLTGLIAGPKEPKI